jgi:hypothetical protein
MKPSEEKTTSFPRRRESRGFNENAFCLAGWPFLEISLRSLSRLTAGQFILSLPKGGNNGADA